MHLLLDFSTEHSIVIKQVNK